MADKRSVRTEQAIKQAYQTLVMSGAARPIKVAALAEEAGINRKTFYSHYDTIEDLEASFNDDVTAEITSRFEAHDFDYYVTHRGALVQVFVDFFVANQNFYSYVMREDHYSDLARQVQRQVVRYIAGKIVSARGVSHDEATMIGTFIMSTMLNMLRMQLSGETHFDRLVVRAHITELIMTGLSEYQGFRE